MVQGQAAGLHPRR